jgi:hypothetical protein
MLLADRVTPLEELIEPLLGWRGSRIGYRFLLGKVQLECRQVDPRGLDPLPFRESSFRFIPSLLFDSRTDQDRSPTPSLQWAETSVGPSSLKRFHSIPIPQLCETLQVNQFQIVPLFPIWADSFLCRLAGTLHLLGSGQSIRATDWIALGLAGDQFDL